jgi:hypothetical protein
MKNNLDDVESALSTKSQVSRDVTKWQVQSTLRDIKLSMRKATKGFKVEDNLARCFAHGYRLLGKFNLLELNLKVANTTRQLGVKLP